ncbi:RnfABCDGE type electron transport complex subunit D [Leadbettera azotonutricia]|uniref:Ion-translocating oxidoreductase complex subunit D n=1 Tax=Leadbettera azotonutricia (strain ATCC BAA-888 / DSM 13862 / ZAS-9) TaxID=545695 RepID=F5YEF1_LEAAZ|nr:RnfABCDGE type electron transport complex subunit D [Leadbettera azotonutricia]AEF82540.1 na(+)-translocating NADH-quinone reductase subunit b (na(+)-translocating nqr subunit b) (na(+)-nqr subunit b) (nqr complexsubunit b) (nqr-1 subunit b) [Leadbettera azotonutricia ZAS-9]
MSDTKAEAPLLLLSSSPHIASPVGGRVIMAWVLAAIAPAAIFGVALFGIPALLNIVVSIAAAEFAEFAFRKITKQELRNGDLSAAVTGLLLALIIPPGLPLWMTALGSIFAIVVAKEFFGGLGANVFNPALIGRAFLLMSFPAAATTWQNPSFFGAVDAVGAATPLRIIKSGGSLSVLGDSYGAIVKTLFLGTHAGSIGESSIVLILLGFAVLLLKKIIDWRAPVVMTATVFAFSFLLGRDPLAAILSGGVVFGAVFMATDYVSAPVTATGKLIFGFGAGLITVLIRQWGNYPEGVSYGILIMNAATPFLNRLIQKKYGWVQPRKPAAADAAKAGAK